MYFIRYIKILKTLTINLIILGSLASVSLVIIEVLLRSKIINEDSQDAPTYIPLELVLKDQLIDRSGYSDHYGFRSIDGHNKIQRLTSMQKNGCNIVVLGDSLIWGDGVGPESRWTDILNEKLKGCKVHSFGKNGWNSLEEFQFYESHLKDLNFDHLLIGYVGNDPHLALRPPNSFYHLDAKKELFYSKWDDKYLLIRGKATIFGVSVDNPLKCKSIKCDTLRLLQTLTLPSRTIPKIARKLRINSIDYIDQKSKFIFDSIFNSFYPLDGEIQNASQILTFGYANWKNFLYEERNFSDWKSSLNAFARKVNHPTTFVLTTVSTGRKGDKSSRHYSKVISAFKESGFDYVNCNISYEGFRKRSEWANPADGHPGSNEVDHYAICAEEELRKKMLR